MKGFVLASALLAGTISTVSAVEVWQGDMFITAASAGCAATPHGVGSFYRSVYRPNGVEDNGNFEAISFVTPRAVFRVAVNGSFPAAGSYFAAGIGSSAGLINYTATYSNLSIKPAAITPTTPAVTIRIRVNDFFNSPGCSATLAGVLGNRPDL